MSRGAFLVICILWGLLLGSLAALAVAALMLGVGWLYLFGDDAWPAQYRQIALPIASVLAGLIAFALCFVLPLRRDRLRQKLGRKPLLGGAATVMPLFIAAGLLTALWQAEETERRDLAAERRQEAPVPVQIRSWAFDSAAGTLRIQTAVSRGPAVELVWHVHGPGLEGAVAAGSHSAATAAERAQIELDLRPIALTYAAAVMTRLEPAELDVTFTVELARSGADGLGTPVRVNVPVSFAVDGQGGIRFHEPAVP